MTDQTTRLRKFYTGVGSRELPGDIYSLMQALGKILQEQGWVLRSGGAGGADSAFESAVTPQNKQIYLPWKGFSDFGQWRYDRDIWHQAELIASQPTVYPGWNNTSLAPKKLHAIRKLQTRNVFQVLGDDLQSPSKFLVCWTPDGAINRQQYRPGKTGGTGTAINLASQYRIPVYNLKRYEHRIRIEAFVKRSLSSGQYASVCEQSESLNLEMSV